MEQSPSLEANSPRLVKKVSLFMEPEGSLQCPQELANGL
jgi:hypothetical protein